MRLSSLRVRSLILTVLFALVLVGAVSVVSYVVVTDAMADVAEATLRQIAESSSRLLRESVTDARLDAASTGLVGDELEEAALAEVVDSLPGLLHTGGTATGEFALYDQHLDLIWYTDPLAIRKHDAHRIVAAMNEQTIDSGFPIVTRLTGIVGSADMGEYVAHVPVELPGARLGVLDVVYVPTREEATIDRIRPWMMLLAFAATLIAIVLMQTSTGWVLGLIGDLRRAADLVDADELDVHLPELGHHEIGDLARSLNGLIHRLRRRADAQTRFVADASHELATPVAGIRGYVGILREWGGDDPALREEAIEAIDRESSRMARLCSDLLSLIRRERFVDVRPTRVDVNALARDVLANAATRYFDKGIEFVGPSSEGQLIVFADQDRLAQVINILVDNAAKYTPEGGSIDVKTWRRHETIGIEISDTGVGISEDDLPHVFERFYRSDESRSSDTGGFGIGLSIAKRVVDLLGGKVDVESTEGVGTTFTVRIPRRASREAGA
jgi:signal transduction histidine kinase